MTYEYLIVEEHGPVLWVTMNRPESLNALIPPMITELRNLYQSLQQRWDLRVVVLTGAGRGFSSGADIKQRSATGLGSDVGVAILRSQRAISEVIIAMRRCPQPIVSLINGPAAGGGMAFALASDIRIATPTMKMNAAFIKIGLSACDVGVSYFLPRMVGASVAAELMLTGRFIGPERALALGLVSAVVPHEELHAEGEKFVAEMLEATPMGLRLTKECLNHAIDAQGLEAAIAMEDRNQVITFMSKDAPERRNAFVEKRSPIYGSEE